MQKQPLFVIFRYMNITDKNLKVLNITHFDMDGACCHIILKNYYKSVTALPITYQSEKTLFAKATEEINKEHYDLIICTDFYPEIAYKDLSTLKVPMIVLDHHESAKKFHNGKTIVINTQNSASKLVFDLYNKLSDLSHLEDLVNIVDDFDMYKKKDVRSPEFNKIFWEMNFKWFVRRFIKGNTKLTEEEILFLKESMKAVDKIYNNIEITTLPHKGVFFILDYYQYEITERLKKDGYKWFIILNKNNLSIRSNDVDLLPIINRVGRGGGHKNAVGIALNWQEDPKFLVNKIIKSFNEIYPAY